MLLGLAASVLGIQMVMMGIVAKVLYDYQGQTTAKWMAIFEYNRAMLVSMALFAMGVMCGGPLVDIYLYHGFRLPLDLGWQNYLAVTGLLMVIVSFLVFSFTLVLHATESIKRRNN
jgi:hypothetical protein